MKQTFFLVLIFLSININAQTILELYSTENSNISENDLKSILVEKKSNNKLIGTSKSGLLKFDNVKFEKIQEIKGEYFGPLYEDKSGNIWVSSSNPEDIYIIKSNNEIVKINSEILNEINGVIAISEDNQGNLYFGGKGLVKFDGEKWNKVELPNNSITIRTLDVSAENLIAIGHNSGLLIGKENNWKSYEEETDKLQLSTVRAVKFIDKNKLVIGYGGGFGNGGFSIKENDKWTHFNKTNSKISDHMVRDIEIDQNKTLWMATNDGLVKFTEKGELTSILFREGFYKNTILDINIDNENVLWIATNFGLIKFKE